MKLIGSTASARVTPSDFRAAGKDPLQFQIDLLGKDELLPGRGAGFNTACGFLCEW